MRIINLKDCYLYTPVIRKIDGEISKTWEYKTHLRVNIQQDINELDRSIAGIIEYEKLKLRFDKEIPIEKNDGISLYEMKIKNNFSIEVPKYIVTSKIRVGRCITCICEVNQNR